MEQGGTEAVIQIVGRIGGTDGESTSAQGGTKFYQLEGTRGVCGGP